MFHSDKPMFFVNYTLRNRLCGNQSFETLEECSPYIQNERHKWLSYSIAKEIGYQYGLYEVETFEHYMLKEGAWIKIR